MAPFPRSSLCCLTRRAAIVAATALTPLAAQAQQAQTPAAIYPIVADATADPLLANLAIPANAAQAGMWSQTAAWPIVAIHAAMLPDGRILTLGAPQGGSVKDGRTLVFWDPHKGLAAGAFQIVPNAQNVDSFCSSATLLSDGRLLTSGGASSTSGYSSRESMVVDWKTSTPARDYDLTAQRWYATMTKLPDGRAIITGGGAPYTSADPNRADAANDVSSTPEVYTPGQGWRSLIGAYSTDAFGAKNARWWYPRQWVSPAGTLFGISTDKIWEMRLDGNGAIRTIGDFKTPPGMTSRINSGPTSTAVMYDTGKILQVGGGGYYNGYDSLSSANATLFDITQIASGTVKVTEGQPMNAARQWATSTVLPDGRVVVTGGTGQGDRQAAGVYSAETWDPGTGSWTVGAASANYRSYHSSAMLLLDGAVLVGGGGIPGPVTNLNADIYYPAYLFARQGNGSVLAARPQIISLSKNTANYGDVIQLQTGGAGTIREVSLIATAAVTHGFNSNQRRMKLAFTPIANGIGVTVPASPNLAPPGYYELSVVNTAGVPSAATIVAIGAAAPGSGTTPTQGGQIVPAKQAPSLGASIAFEPATWPGYLIRHQNFLGMIAPITSKSDALSRFDASFIVRAGRGDATCLSFEAVNYPGYFLQHEDFRVKLKLGDTSAASQRGSTFCPRGALNGSADPATLSFESLDWPGYFIRHKNFETWLIKYDGTASAAADSTFRTSAAGLVPQAAASMGAMSQPGYLVRHANFIGYIAQIGSASSAGDKLDASFIVRPGLADTTCVSLESKNYPGFFLRHANFQLRLMKDDGVAANRRDATFCVRPSLNGATSLSAVSLESLSWPGYFIRHKDYGLWIMQNDDSADAHANSSFTVTTPLP
ncbi:MULTISPECIES: AbfB domain-containing protein [unclassified Sphingomonas]|uniref:AbfB domain-containing protein n=1 Tax=unclassified Sphingomonas TaxID=196159 RepID=UPI00226A3AC8|nr:MULTISPECIES: AbfB domain-containing protein [unclassified Sphingomonas]